MNFEYSEDEKILQSSVKKLFKNKFSLNEVRNFLSTGNIPASLKLLLADQGLLGTTTWNKQRNMKEGVIYSVLIAYEAGRALIPFPLIENHVSSYILNKFNKSSIVEKLVSGEELITVAWESRGNNAKKNFDTYTVNGEFSYISFADDSNYMLTNITIEGQKESVVLIDLKSPNVSMIKRKSMDETYPLYNVTLKNYEVTTTNLIGEVGTGTAIFDEMKAFARLLLCSEMVGSCEEVLEKTVNYANERKQFEQVISKFQAIKHMASDMKLLLESSKSALDYATWVVDSNSDETEKVIPLLKSYVSEASNEIAGKSIQIHGGIGYTWESDVHLYFKRARRSSVMLGDAYYHREQIAKYIEKEFLQTPVKS